VQNWLPLIIERGIADWADADVAKSSTAIPVRKAFFIDRHPSTLLPECKCVQSVAGVFDKRAGFGNLHRAISGASA
jgi:hypothetical protein